MKIVKLGEMKPDYMAGASSEEPEKKVERFPCVYISHEDLPKLKVGETVVLHGKVVEFGERSRKTKEDGKTSTEEHRNVEIDVTELHVEGSAYEKEDEEPSDEDDIDKGLDEAETPTSEDDDEE